MSAERSRRAVVTESEGQKQAAVTVAEGQKLALVLGAEAQKQAAILAAEGERESAVIRAEGLAGALRAVDASAQDADPTTILLQYFTTLRELGGSASTKFVVPVELTSLLGGLKDLGGLVTGSTTQSRAQTNGNGPRSVESTKQ
jgi:regulator of protease activity HflC (stomatin/prohibitin superfamily)